VSTGAVEADATRLYNRLALAAFTVLGKPGAGVSPTLVCSPFTITSQLRRNSWGITDAIGLNKQEMVRP